MYYFNDEFIMKKLNGLQEHKMAKDIFTPLLRKKGLQGVKFTGGSNEEGIDIEYYEKSDADDIRLYAGIQFKKGNITYSSHAKSGTVKDLKNQAEEAFEKDICDVNSGGVYHISRYIVAATGEITENARKMINKAKSRGEQINISYWDQGKLAEDIRTYFLDEFMDYFSLKSLLVKDQMNISIDNNLIDNNRKKKIDEIKQAYSGGQRVVFLSGDPGIGKTTLAKLYANSSNIKHIYMVTYDGALESTIEKLLDRNSNKKGTWRSVIDELKKVATFQDEPTLLIIDNFGDNILGQENSQYYEEELNGECYKSLINTGIFLLFTTRIHTKINEIRVDRVEDTFDLFQRYTACNLENNKEEIEKIIEAVHGNTLLIILAAHIWTEGSEESRKSLYERLSSANVISENTEIPMEIDAKDKYYRKTIYTQVEEMIHFDGVLNNLSFRNILLNAALLPIKGIDRIEFMKLINLKNVNDLNILINHSWISTDKSIIFMHPVIREIIIRKAISFNMCKEYCGEIEKLISLSDNNKKFDEKLKYLEYAEEIYNVFKGEKDKLLTELFYSLSDIYDKISKRKEAKLVIETVLRNLDTLEDPLDRAEKYSGAAFSFNNYEKSQENLNYAMSLLKKANEELNNTQDVTSTRYRRICAKIKSNMGSYYLASRDYNRNNIKENLEQAYDCHKKSLDIRRMYVLLNDNPKDEIEFKKELAVSCTNLATVCYHQAMHGDLLANDTNEKFNVALKLHNEALVIRKSLGESKLAAVNQQRIIGCKIEKYRRNFDPKELEESLAFYPDLISTYYETEQYKELEENINNFIVLNTIFAIDKRLEYYKDDISKKKIQILDSLKSKESLKKRLFKQIDMLEQDTTVIGYK